MGIMTQDPAADNIGDPGQEPVYRVGKRWIASIALANLGLYLGYIGPLIVLLPNQAQAIAGADHKVAVLGWVTGIGAAVAMVANPAAGALFPARPDPLQQTVPWPDGAGRPARPDPDLHGCGRADRRHRRHRFRPPWPEKAAGHGRRADHRCTRDHVRALAVVAGHHRRGRDPRAGIWVYLSVDQALVTQVLPSAAGRAKDLGIINIRRLGCPSACDGP